MTAGTALVTGGAGFIGANVARHLLTAGHRVVVLDNLSGGKQRYVPSGATFVHGDICDAALLQSLFARHQFDYVFHLAAYAAEGLSHFIKRFNYTNNVVGSASLINAAVNAGTVRCFVFTSSIAVYGGAVPPVAETQAPEPEDPYGIAKLAVEHDLRHEGHVRPAVHHLPAAQRLRRVPEHRRPVPQRHRHLHEPGPAG